jgi:hypothetical protein
MTKPEHQNRSHSLSRPQHSAPIALAIWGDSVVSLALVLLLRSSGYKARFLPASSFNKPGVLKSVRLLLLGPTPQLSTEEERQAFLGSLRNTAEAATIPVLELRVLGEESQEQSAKHDDSWHYVPWPCRAEELEQQIEALISCHYGELEAKEQEALRARSRGDAQQSPPSRRSASG